MGREGSRINIVGEEDKSSSKAPREEAVQTVKKEKSKQLPTTAETAQKHAKVRSRYIDLKVSAETYFPNNKRVNSELLEDRPPNMFRDMRQSIELDNNSLNTDSLDLSEECDFTEELSERCQDRDVAVKGYFGWKKETKEVLETVSQ
jgi:hypothetical protein